MRYSTTALILTCFILLSGCNKEESTLFELLPPSKSGIQFENTLSEDDSLNILDYLYFYNGGGLAMGDINNDGLPDLYFAGNQTNNKLYLNKGDLTFEDITTTSKTDSKSSWNTGSIMADFNGDGWLDIYVISVVGINNFQGHNELFINNKDLTFTESAAQYGLDFQTYGTTAAAFDYDLDGDLDLYLLNHAVHTEGSFGRAQIREERNERTGDRLLRNDGHTFTDVSIEAGIYGGINGYGLGLTVADFNMDGYPDLYIGNDFHEDDYFYINNGDGTFKESLKEFFGHTSRFSMGNDAADINNDGWPDLISLDMTPEDETVLKSSEGDDTYHTLKMRTQQYGYHYQFTRNMLYLNNQGAPFTETAILSGVPATDWSWSALFGDFDQDGAQDLFVSNGIPKRPNDLDFIRFISSEEIRTKINETKLVDQTALELMPSGIVPNYIFKGDGRGNFEDRSNAWIKPQITASGATAIGDLDNDGDLDIVTNNINAPASVYVNNSTDNSSFLKLKFDYSKANAKGIGTKVFAYQQGTTQYRELFPNKGWQATSDATLHFGFANASKLDSLRVIWPDGTTQKLTAVALNQTLQLDPSDTTPYHYKSTNSKALFKKVEGNLGIDFIHQEDNHTDFNYQKLIPFEVSDRGPAFTIGDFNFDGQQDIFFGNSRNKKPSVYLQKEGEFKPENKGEISKDSLYEDVTASYVSSGSSKSFQLYVGTGGNAITTSAAALKNRVYEYGRDSSKSIAELNSNVNTSVIVPFPTENNRHEIFVGNHTTPLDYGNIPASGFLGNYTFKNEPHLGMITDAIATDFDKDGQTDLIVVGEWMPPKFYKNNGGVFEEVNVLKQSLHGLWQCIQPFDIDQDGDTDYLLGNWGENSKLIANETAPLRMYYADFDNNGSTETVISIQKNGKYYPLLGLNELAEQLVFLRKKFNAYSDFAGKTMEEIFTPELLKKATVFEVHTLSSGFLRNNNNSFNFEPFPKELQVSPIMAFENYDFFGNGKESVVVGGNYFGVIPFHGRFDSFSGALIKSENEITLGNKLGLNMEHKSVRHLKTIEINNQPFLLIVYNNDAAEVYEIIR